MKGKLCCLVVIFALLASVPPVLAQQDMWRVLRDTLIKHPDLEYDTDRPGMDYRSFDLPAADPKLCQNECAGDPNCRAFTYVRPGVQGPKARCWLKSNVPAAVNNPCCVSGLKPTAPAQAGPPGIQVQVQAYGHDESDGSDVGWNSQYPNPSFDDEPNRRGYPNARWQGSHYWQGDRLCLAIQNLEAPYPPGHTLAVGYTVTLQGATFEDGSATKTFVMYRYSGVPPQKNISQCYPVVFGAVAATPPPPPSKEGLLEELVVPNTRPQKILSRTVLEMGREYIIEASGTFDDWGNTPHGIDAVWCFAEWRCGRQGEAWNQLIIDGKGMTAIAGQTIPYNPQHVYRVNFKGQGKPVEFYMIDAQNSWSDNLGAVTVRILGFGGAPAPPPSYGRGYTDVRPRPAPASFDLTGRWGGTMEGTITCARWPISSGGWARAAMAAIPGPISFMAALRGTRSSGVGWTFPMAGT